MAAGSIVRGWLDRVRGRLRPVPMPFAEAAVLDLKGRHIIASPKRVLGAFGLATGERVLEVGPGTGFYSVAAAQRVRLSGRLVCLDIQREMLIEVRRRIRGAGLDASFIQASATALPLRSGSFDHVYLIGVLGEIPSRPAALAEFRRVLCRSGRLSVSEQFPDPDFITRGTLRRELQAMGFVEDKTRGLLWYTSTWRLHPQQSSAQLLG